jgi:hypothetical protein
MYFVVSILIQGREYERKGGGAQDMWGGTASIL